MPRERKLTHLDLLAGPGGWIQASWRRSDGSEGRVFTRFKRPRGKTGWWRLTDLQVPDPSTALLREVPLRKIEIAVNASDVISDTLAKWITEEPPANNLAAAFRKRYRATPRHAQLERPTTRRLDDSFYRDVGWAYREAAAHGLNPAETLAADSGTPQGTVNRWIAKARQLGYLPPGEQGKVTF